WKESQTFEGSGRYNTVSFKDKIYLLGSRRSGEKSMVTLRIYDKGIWSEPKALPVYETLLDLIPAVFNDRLIIFERGFFSSNYYLVEDAGDGIQGPFHIQRHSLLSDNKLWKLLALGLLPNIFFLISIFLLSAFIRKFKLKTWRNDSVEYEFGSLFRRFLAKFIDSIIVTIPAALILYAAFKKGELLDNPFRFVGLILIFSISLLLGSFLYHSLLEGLWGRTVGKRLCGIVVLSDDFTRCTIWKGFLRNLLRIIDCFFYYLVAVVSLAGTMKWQRLGDIAAGTVVVRYGQKKRIQS
ncbi:MAG TPA: RDD family protein, partial [Thermodesulfovibrionales bacterium]|nr:RDD family protein [Thermodesulfovibrionales bacterium]